MRIFLKALMGMVCIGASASFGNTNTDIQKRTAYEELLSAQLEKSIVTGELDKVLQIYTNIDDKKNWLSCDVVRCLSRAEILAQSLADIASSGDANKIRRMLSVIQAISKLDDSSIETIKNRRHQLLAAELTNLAFQMDAYLIAKSITNKSEVTSAGWLEPWGEGLKVLVNKSVSANKMTPRSSQSQSDNKIMTLYQANQNIFEESKWEKATDWINLNFAMRDLLNRKPLPRSNVTYAARIFNESSDVHKYDNGRFMRAPKLFMLCRQDRAYPCLVVLKNRLGMIHRRADGSVWSQPALGLSAHGLKFNQRNGNTPSGVMRIDGVMPFADKKESFGKYRRLILNFIAKVDDEENIKNVLPPSTHTGTWWGEGVEARDIGRSELRIHGTGRTSVRGKTYFPLVPTSGCIAQRENKYDEVEYHDQRLILDELMRAQDLQPTRENEAQISALLYIIDINANKAPVTLAELNSSGIVP